MNRKWWVIFFGTLLSGFSGQVAGQTVKQVNPNSLVWFAYFNQTRLSDKVGIWLDVHARRIDWLDRWSAVAVRPGVTFYLSDKVRLTAGYAYFNHYPPLGQRTIRTEHRLWQQASWSQGGGRWQVSHRLRTEQRFNKNIANDVLQFGYAFNHRFRYQLGLGYLLAGKAEEAGAFTIQVSDEILINAGRQIKLNYFDQNRFTIALGYQISKSSNLQVGYMNLFQQLPNGSVFNNNHVVRTYFLHNTDLRRKKG
jgi:hypothetical protein